LAIWNEKALTDMKIDLSKLLSLKVPAAGGSKVGVEPNQPRHDNAKK